MNGNIVESYFDVVKGTTEVLGVQENLEKLFKMNETGHPANSCPEKNNHYLKRKKCREVVKINNAECGKNVTLLVAVLLLVCVFLS
jgi:hypothetical protein